jgi:tagatose 1,6-diphosphate aldolase
MAELSAGKVRGLTSASNRAGLFTILAVDHRDAMRAVLDPDHPEEVAPQTLTDLKLALLRGVGDLASAVLLDPEYSALQAIASRALPGATAFLCAIESQGYLGEVDARVTSLLDGWSVAKAKRLGAAGVKMLLPYRPDLAVADEQDRAVAAVVAECAKEDIPFFLEPVAYPVGNAKVDRRRIVCDSARRLGALGPDVLKVQFPVDTSIDTDPASWADACAELNESCPVPWALLSGGGSYESFRDQLVVACRAGASGFLVGRALWLEYVTAPIAEQSRILDEVVRPRFFELAGIATATGSDWAGRYRLPELNEDSFRSY